MATFPDLGRPVEAGQSVGRYSRLFGMNHIRPQGMHDQQCVAANASSVSAFLGHATNVVNLAWMDYEYRATADVGPSPELRAVYEGMGKVLRTRQAEMLQGAVKRLPIFSLFVVDRQVNARGQVTGLKLASPLEIIENKVKAPALSAWLGSCPQEVIITRDDVNTLRRHSSRQHGR